jgi:hemolysin activation/secretion protein
MSKSFASFPRGYGVLLISLVCLISATQEAFADDAPKTAAPQNGSSAAQSQPKKQQTFDIWEYRLDGNTLLSTIAIEKALYPYLGPDKTIEDVQSAADNLERAYRDAGYPAIYVDIPVQDVVAGVVMLKVTEGKIGRVTVRGARYFTPSGIREQLPSLQPGQPLAAADVQEQIKELNARSGDLRVAPILRPGPKQGDVDVELRVKDTLPVHGGIEYNNFNSIDTSRPRLRATLSYDNLWQSAHSFGLTYQVAPEHPSELSVISASYGVPLDPNWRLSAYAVKSETDVKTQVDASVGGNELGVLGDGKVGGLRFIRTLPAGSDYTQVAIFGVDYKDFNQQVEEAEQPIRYVQWSAQYNATLLGEKSLTSFNVATDFGVRGLVNDENQFAEKRSGAHAGYVYFSGGISRTDTFAHDWQLLSRAHAQLTDSPLIDNEQFSVGGFSSVRGYYESQVLGDYGYFGGLEIHTPSAAQWFSDNLSDLRALVFYELGEVRIKDALPEQATHHNLESVGVGVQLQALDHLRVLWNIAYPLKDSDPIEQGDWRSYVRVNVDF